MSSDLAAATPLDKVSQLLGKTLRVKISDGRLVEGDLQCLDREMNLVLISALEYYNYTGNHFFIYSVHYSCTLLFCHCNSFFYQLTNSLY
jgi:small nuclear ribonucleoprotein (snRNP)-like protein